MAVQYRISPLKTDTAPLVSELAEYVLSNLSETAPSMGRRFEVATTALMNRSLQPGAFQAGDVLSELYALRVEDSDIVGVCIPAVARALGEAWVEDDMAFSDVSLASSRLFGLCKDLGEAWNNMRPSIGSRSCFVASFEREHHLLGPAVLSDSLRRRGHSVTVMSNTTADRVAERLNRGRFDCLMVSVASLEAYGGAVDAIGRVRDLCNVPVFLGGAVLQYANDIDTVSGADLVTSDVDVALDELSRIEKERGRVAGEL